jgi:antitoxin component of RelBE/YafQ-DinJ toxin-antitoxin module
MEKQKDNYLRIRIDNETKMKYIKYCNINGFSLSKRIRLFIEKELNEGKDIKI